MALKRPKSAPPSDPFAIEHVQRRTALAGATAIVDLGDGSSWRTWKFGNRDWQAEGWRLYDIIGELHKLSGRVGDSVAQARLYVTEVDETGEEQGEVTDEAIRRLAAVPLGTGSQRDDNLRLAGIDLAVGGECWIVGEGAATAPEKAEGSWFVVTGAALSREGGLVKVRRPQQRGGSKLTLQDGKDILIRCWRPHPNDTDQADSFTRSAIVPLREIELLTKREFSELDSRLTGAGVWFLPEGIDFPRAPEDPLGIAGFMAYIQRAAAASMADQGTASSMVPIMATLPDEMITHLDKLQPINFWSDLSDAITPMKDKAITRVASMAEIPAEVLTGIGDANHWSAWLISDEGIRWIRGYLGIIADALTRGFLHRALGSMGNPTPERYVFRFDTSALAAKPNRLEEALQLHDRFLITDNEVVKSGAFDPDQMPTVAQRAAQILLKLVTTQPDLILDPAVQQLLGLPEVKGVSLPATAGQNAGGDPAEDDEDETSDGPPNKGEAPDGPDDDGQAGAITSALDARILELTAARVVAPVSPEMVFNASAKLMVMRALELAGGRLTTPQERRGRWADVPRHELHHHVGPITPEKAARVTEGAWNHVALVASDLGVNEDDLGALLSGYVMELLTRGLRHHDDLLYAALSIANRGNGLMASGLEVVEDDAAFHLPGRHDQKSHGRRRGTPGNPAKTPAVKPPTVPPAVKAPTKAPRAKAPTKTPAVKPPNVKPSPSGAVDPLSRSASFAKMYADKIESDESEPAQMYLEQLERVPDNLKRQGLKGVQGVVLSGETLPNSGPVGAKIAGSGLLPRGYPAGMGWEVVGGVYSREHRVLIVAKPEGMPLHRMEFTPSHEFGHGIDDSLDQDQRNTSVSLIRDLHKVTSMNPYFTPEGNPHGWKAETFAQVVAGMSHWDPTDTLTPDLEASVMWKLDIPLSHMDAARPVVTKLIDFMRSI